ncbi:MAG: hypothetical protein WDO19_24360 [Bacteroidota bacterium]
MNKLLKSTAFVILIPSIGISVKARHYDNFNVYMNIRFTAADFNPDKAGSKKEFVISISNTKVNRA